MEIDILIIGELNTNCYILKKDRDIIIIDPAANSEVIINKCINYNVVGILVTHHHFDHIGALKEIEKNYDLIHNSFTIPNFNFTVLKTPGHTMDSISFYFPEEKILFSGDFIFKGTIGRCDFPESNIKDMQDSLNKILK